MADPVAFAGLLAGGWRDMIFAPFRDGVEIATLRADNPAVALLRYAPGASVPHHEHMGLEMILVLDGAQTDERGTYPAGTLVLNPAGSAHSVWSVGGTTVLIQWERPVRFTGPVAVQSHGAAEPVAPARSALAADHPASEVAARSPGN